MSKIIPVSTPGFNESYADFERRMLEAPGFVDNPPLWEPTDDYRIKIDLSEVLRDRDALDGSKLITAIDPGSEPLAIATARVLPSGEITNITVTKEEENNMDNTKYGLGISDADMDARLDAALERGENLASGKIEPENEEDQFTMWFFRAVKYERNPEQKRLEGELSEKMSIRKATELNLSYNKPSRYKLEDLPAWSLLIEQIKAHHDDVCKNPLRK